MTLKSKNKSTGKMWMLGAASTLALGAALAGCGASSNGGDSGSTSTPTTGVNLIGAGSTFVYPIMAKWTDAYNKAKGVQVNYQSVGSGAGIKQFSNQTVDFGASDAPLKDDDLKKLPSPAIHLPIIAGGVVVAYNLPGVSAKLKMSGPVIADIYLGKIKKWNDPALMSLNPGVKLPATAITVAHRSDGSGTTYIFTNYLKAASAEWSTKVGAGKSVDWPVGLGGKGNEGVAGIIKQSPGGLGYVELAYARQNDFPYATVKNSTGQFVDATSDSISAAAIGAMPQLQKDVRTPIANSKDPKAYPISGFTYILVYSTQKDAAKGASLKDFLKWALTDGQKMASSLDYAPLPPGVVAMNEKAIDSIG